MTRDLRALVRERLETGELPPQLPDLVNDGPGSLWPKEVLIGTVAGAVCTLCLSRGPHVTYSYRSGCIIRLHAACQGAWRPEVRDGRSRVRS